jgi:serine/threonine protein kinase
MDLLNSYKEFVIFDFAQGTLPNFGDLAIKRLNTEAGLEELKNEVKMLAKLDHPNIIRMLGSCTGNNENVICYEYMPGGSLDAVLFGMYFL